MGAQADAPAGRLRRRAEAQAGLGRHAVDRVEVCLERLCFLGRQGAVETRAGHARHKEIVAREDPGRHAEALGGFEQGGRDDAARSDRAGRRGPVIADGLSPRSAPAITVAHDHSNFARHHRVSRAANAVDEAFLT
ncbi:MAG: hypothetical protein AAF763_19995, partial [Pseudomonadota bacterium]